MRPNTGKPLYYGWVIVATSFFIAFATVGTRNGFGVFVNTWSDPEGLGWKVGLISLAASIGVLASGVFQPFLGAIYDKFGGRKVILSGLVILGSCTLLLGLTPNIVFLILIYGLVASLGMSAGSLNTTSALLTRWFRRQRSTALGIATAGASAGGLILVPFAMYLLQATDSWRLTWVALGVIVLMAVPLAYLLLQDDPKDMGLRPDGDDDSASASGQLPAHQARGPLEVEYWTESFKSPPCILKLVWENHFT